MAAISSLTSIKYPLKIGDVTKICNSNSQDCPEKNWTHDELMDFVEEYLPDEYINIGYHNPSQAELCALITENYDSIIDETKKGDIEFPLTIQTANSPKTRLCSTKLRGGAGVWSAADLASEIKINYIGLWEQWPKVQLHGKTIHLRSKHDMCLFLRDTPLPLPIKLALRAQKEMEIKILQDEMNAIFDVQRYGISSK